MRQGIFANIILSAQLFIAQAIFPSSALAQQQIAEPAQTQNKEHNQISNNIALPQLRPHLTSKITPSTSSSTKIEIAQETNTKPIKPGFLNQNDEAYEALSAAEAVAKKDSFTIDKKAIESTIGKSDFASDPLPSLLDPITGKQIPTISAEPINIKIRALLTANGAEIPSGIVWRIFNDQPGPDGKLDLVADAIGGSSTFPLQPGGYLVHAAYGRAGATIRITVAPQTAKNNTVIFNAGGIRLNAVTDNDVKLPKGQVEFDIYHIEEGETQPHNIIAEGIKSDQIIRLNAGTYNVVSKYGHLNAVVRADIRVEAGKLTDATIYQKAAQMTFKLVNEPGGEALANTSWTILTPGGDVIHETVGAFPSLVLSEGQYSVIARNEGRIFNKEFSVEAGLDREIEVISAFGPSLN